MGHGDRTLVPPSDPFPYDDADIADYAKEAMGWAVDQKLIQVRTASTVSLKEPATRAEVATILMRYIQLARTKDKYVKTADKETCPAVYPASA